MISKMEDKELSELLNEYDKKISQTLDVNIKLLRELKTNKTKSHLRRLLISRIIELVIVMIINFLLGKFLYNNWGSPGLVISSGVIMLFTIFAMSGSIRQIVIISKFDINLPVVENQKILASLQSYMIFYLRAGFLQIPFYLGYLSIGFRIIFGVDIWKDGNLTWLFIQLGFSVILLPLAWWIFKKISKENMNIKWVRSIIDSSGGKTISKAMEFLNEIEDFQTK